MVKTYGLTHIALAVRDPERSLRFYEEVFGARESFREEGRIEVQTPGCRDVITFNRSDSNAGESAGIAHFGFRLTTPDDIEEAVESVKRAGGRIIDHGEFSPGYPFLYFEDPDGYVIEVWYE